MARDNEYLTSNRRIRYPFADDTTLGISDDKAVVIFGCFVDTMLQLKSPTSTAVPKIKGITINAHTLRFTLYPDGASGLEDVPLFCTRSTTRFPIIHGECSWCWYTFVLSSEGIREFEELSASIGDVSEKKLSFSTRCVGASTYNVSSLLVYGGEKTNASGNRYTRLEAIELDPDVVMTGDVTFKAGYNMKFSSEDNGFSINAVAGAGMGVAPCGCTSEDVTFKTPGLLSEDGHLRIFNDTCYDLAPGKYSDTNGILAMHVKCKACCTCGMYADIVNNRLIPLRDKIMDNRASINETLATYESNVSKWNTRLATATADDIVMTTTGVALDAAATELNSSAKVNGKMDRCGFSVNVRNDSFVGVTITGDEFMSNGTPFEAQVAYMKDSTTPVVMPVQLDVETTESSPIFSVTLEPGRSAVLTYFIRLNNMVKTDRQTGFLSKIRISAYQGTRLIVRRTKELGL